MLVCFSPFFLTFVSSKVKKNKKNKTDYHFRQTWMFCTKQVQSKTHQYKKLKYNNINQISLGLFFLFFEKKKENPLRGERGE